jgi:hypothetical protein
MPDIHPELTQDDAVEALDFANDVMWRLTAIVDALRKDLAGVFQENEMLRAQLNTPQLHDFSKGVIAEAQHQRHRWGTNHDSGKTPADWFWLVGYLAGKANMSHAHGDVEKALHHTVTAAAALANWHAAILGQTNMRPGSDPVALGIQR